MQPMTPPVRRATTCLPRRLFTSLGVRALVHVLPVSLVACTGQLDLQEWPSPGPDSSSPRTGNRPPNPNGAPGPAEATGSPAPLDPGRVTLRRLNRTEYDNTVRDLLGTSQRPAQRWPGDEVDHGYDTLGAAISVSPVHVELFEASAWALVDELLSLPGDDPRRARVLVCTGTDEACLRQILTGFARRAYRRPVEGAEIDRLLALARRAQAATGRPEETDRDGLRAALTAVLMSPSFLFRVEADPDPASPTAHAVSDHELAVRLSYFLWSSMPDDELFHAADQGKLARDPAALAAQVGRLLADARSGALAEHFAGQWLYTRALAEFEPQRAAYPAYDEALRASMKQETERFFAALVTEGLPLDHLLTADFTFVDDRLARHYGLPMPGGWKRAPLTGKPRGGLLTQASFLMVTSQPDRTSPVKRGAWVLEQLLCSAPPPPPPEVEGFDAPRPGDGTTLRQRLEQHRANPECASCHRIMDPIGLGLENYDGIGSYRTVDNGQPIDARGDLPDGTRFSGPAELAAILARDPRFAACVTEHLMTYAVGRAFADSAARAYVERIADEVKARGATWRTLIDAVVASEAFRTRRATVPTSKGG